MVTQLGRKVFFMCRVIRQHNLILVMLAMLGVANLAVGSAVFAEAPASQFEVKTVSDENDPMFVQGQTIFLNQCADCHGEKAEGVAGVYDDPLIGDLSVGELMRQIDKTMPEGEAEACVGEDAAAVAAYLHYAYYSESARLRNRPPQVSLARLTGTQLRQSLADIYAHFFGSPGYVDERGLKGIYFAGSRWKEENKKIERVDSTLDFDFGKESPGEGISAEEFFIHWSGSLIANQTGDYEIIVRSTVSFKMDFGRNGREFINNHVQSGDKTEFRKVVRLTAGRVYPFQIEYIQRKRKTEQPPASISLSWVPPHGVEEIIPKRHMVPYGVNPTFSLQTKLPPDDRSYGFERGISVDRQWDEATTAAALEFGQIAVDEIWLQYQRNHKKDPDNDRAKLKAFLTELVEVAFREKLSDPLKQLYVDKQLAAERDDNTAIKRVVLMALKSPRFLYPATDAESNRSRQVANRLALTLFDSIPADPWLLAKVDKKQLENEKQVRDAAWRMVNDWRTRGKTRDMLHQWLNTGHFDEITKNTDRYPGFDAELVADMRASFDQFLDDIVWSESSDYRQLFTADWSYTTDRMAEFYGDAWKPAEDGQSHLKKTAGNSKLRLGVLTHPYLMSGLAYFDATSPIHRGVFLTRYVLGRTLRPPNAAFSPLSPDLHPDLTTRERVSLQTSPESCQVCHSRINSVGFTLENFDAVGKFREREGEKTVDSSGSYITRSGEEVTFKDAHQLAQFLAQSDDAHRAFVSRAFQYFVKQPVAAYGTDRLDELTLKFQQSGFNIRNLLVEIAVIAAMEDPTIRSEGKPNA